MSIIIRLQNLPWSANSVDIRRFFSGLSIPEGGVHIVGGEMGDAFIAFSTDEDARLAMAKDGGKIKDMQIKLLLSSRTEMMRVIEQARQQNMVAIQPPVVTPQPPMMPALQQPARIITPTSEPEKRRGRSPSPRRRSRDRSPVRDRRRSPDDRRGSKRDRSKSPRSSRFSSRDMDRRSDRFKRDDRRYDDTRYRDERRSTRDSAEETKKYLDADNVNSRSQLHATGGFRNMQPSFEQPVTASIPGLYPFGNQQTPTILKSFPAAFSNTNSAQVAQSSEHGVPNKSVDFSALGQKLPSSGAYPLELRATPFESLAPSMKEISASVQQQPIKPRRHTRFEPEFVPPSTAPHYTASDTKPVDSQRETSYGSALQSGTYSEARGAWPHEIPDRSENSAWNEKRQGLLNHPVSKNGDFLQVVPMDLDMSPERTPEKEIFRDSVPPRGPSQSYARNSSPRKDERDGQNRGPPMHNDSKVPAMHNDRGLLPRGDNRGTSIHDTGSRGPPSSLTVEVKGLPPDARMDHILDLFRGIPLPAANIRIVASDQGFEKAYIRFVSVADFEEALNRNRRFIHEGRCELVPCPDDAFENASRSQKSKPKPKPRDEDLTIQMRGLPFSCKESDVVGFFDGLGILDLYIDIGPDGRATGTGFVEFGTPEDFRSALAMNGKMIGYRYITISVASKEMMAVARGEEYNPVIHPSGPSTNAQFPDNNQSLYPSPNQGRMPPIHGRPTMHQGRQPPSNNQTRPPQPGNQGRPLPVNVQGGPPSCISMKNLPEGVTNRNIAEFLGQLNIMPQAVHIMLRPDKTPSGDAFAEFVNPEDMETALELDGKPMMGCRVTVRPLSFHEMSEILGKPTPMPPPPAAPTALLRTPCDGPRPRRPLIPQGPSEQPFRERPRMEPPVRGGRPFMGPRQGHMDSGRPFGPGRMRGPVPKPRTFSSGNRPEGRFPPPSSEPLEDFGSPGCVVSINNLHFRAGLEELLDFFHEYHITRDNIIRKYNENRQTTGEARVAFKTPRDAQRAVRELNHKPIMGRPLYLSVL